MKAVQLFPAFSWSCPDCEILNYLPSIAKEITRQDAEELAEISGHDVDDFLRNTWFDLPDRLCCWRCSKEFDVDASTMGSTCNDD